MLGLGRRPFVLLLVSIPLLLFVAGCGDESANQSTKLGVFAAASLKDPFERYVNSLAGVETTLKFAASNRNADQIRKGARPDLFAAANRTIPAQLHEEQLIDRPISFATNDLVVAARADDESIYSIYDLTKSGVTVAVASPSAPVGSYTDDTIGNLSRADELAIRRNIESEGAESKQVLAKVKNGEVDAGFAYMTDVQASRGELKAIALPLKVNPTVTYDIAVVRGTKNQSAAKDFIAGLLAPEGQAILQEAGFGPAPGARAPD